MLCEAQSHQKMFVPFGMTIESLSAGMPTVEGHSPADGSALDPRPPAGGGSSQRDDDSQLWQKLDELGEKVGAFLNLALLDAANSVVITYVPRHDIPQQKLFTTHAAVCNELKHGVGRVVVIVHADKSTATAGLRGLWPRRFQQAENAAVDASTCRVKLWNVQAAWRHPCP
ncbi:hypothetical protein A2G07_00285 [Deinococcus radiodurans R1 = ATCC 13939 = DSM 20539]|nr:hypothetical protein A2G07_00285 [Deinococcus radiodurans R1 = ATCC 13939 = DSM 20539]